jgi:hypothetical protein
MRKENKRFRFEANTVTIPKIPNILTPSKRAASIPWINPRAMVTVLLLNR